MVTADNKSISDMGLPNGNRGKLRPDGNHCSWDSAGHTGNLANLFLTPA